MWIPGPDSPGFWCQDPLCTLLGQGCPLGDFVFPSASPHLTPWDCLLTASCPPLNTISFPEGSNTDRPDASAVHLHDFQRFLLHEQQVRG